MKMVKSLLLGSAAGVAAIAGAQAADLPVKAKAVEYVRVCSTYGAGFYYIPGTETCIKIGGFFRTTIGLNAINAGVALNNPISYNTRDRNYYSSVHRVATQVDVRSNTQYGVLRTYVYTYLTVGNDTAITPTILTAYTQLAGFTLGKFRAPVYQPWSSNAGTYNAGVYAADDASATAGLQYQADFGGGLTASIGVFDARRSGIYDRSDSLTMTTFTNSTGIAGANNASRMPDIQGNVRLEQAWGALHLGAALSEKNVIYNGSTEPTGAAPTKYGYIVNAALNLKQLPTGAGDQFWASVAYTKGDVFKLLGTAPTSIINIYGAGSGTNYNSVFFGNTFDSVFDSATAAGSTSQLDGGKQHLTEAWAVGAAFEHFWIPAVVKTSLYGNYAQIHYDATAKAIICTTNTGASRYGFTAGSVCDPDFKFFTVGSRSTWNVTTDLEVSLDVNYLRYSSASSGTVTGLSPTPFSVLAPFKPTGGTNLYNIADQGMWSGQARVIRSW